MTESTRDKLNKIPIPPLVECGQTLKKLERLKTLFYKLETAALTTTPEESLELINNTLIDVEDCHSGVGATEKPGLIYTGRMYPIQEDNIERKRNGGIVAITKGNKIVIEPSGTFSIFSRIDEELLMTKNDN
ncbi:hypothetical protein JMN32_06825 [Fulvivirga sp. 29W222]|uniref:Uncharacterized protein n=1 Tax=Fulvivirga marina TaxID=2494733 RepID=A0A937KDG0_9BACT|nr:hypothetical protein [Fulvivirga marina]MBL6446015.1 hypothetical protein [Fulvivirga marina]